MLRSRSTAGTLAKGLRGFANAKKPDFYKPGASSANTPAAAKPPPQHQATPCNVEGAAAGKPVPEAAARPTAAATPLAHGAATPAATPVSTTPSAAAAPKPAPPITALAETAVEAAEPAEPAAMAAKTAAPPAATASKPAETAAAALKPAAPAAAAPRAPNPAPTAAAGAGAGSGGQQGMGAAPPGGGGGGNSWLLHPTVPIDVRLLGVGFAGAGALVYGLRGSGDSKPAPPKAGMVEEADFIMQPETVLEAGDAEAAPAEAAAAPPEGGGAPPAAAGEAAAAAEEDVTYVDGSKVLGVIEEVFSKEAAEQVRKLKQQAEAETAAAAAASQHNVREAGREAAAGEAKAVAAEARAAAAEAKAESKAAATAAATQHAEERVAAIQAAVADQAGESIASDFVQSMRPDPPSLTGLLQAGKQKDKAAAQAATAQVREPRSGDMAEALAAAQRLLGTQVDVSAAGLIALAMKHGMGPAEDWSDYSQRHRQAEADATVLAELLEAAGASVERQLAAARREAEAGQAEAAAARCQLAQQAESFRAVLREVLGRAEEQQRQQLRRQAEQLAMAHAEMTVRERAERATKLDGVREQLNALERAFQRRSSEQRSSHGAHQLSTAVFALRSALAAGQPLGQALSFLCGMAAADPVVAAAVAAVPEEAVATPVPTRSQLADQFLDVQRLSRELSMLPAGQGGMLSVAVAKLAAKLKIAERGSLAAAHPVDSINRRLAAAQQHLLDGELLAAAAELEAAVAGTAAAGVVAEWTRAVRIRATAELSTAMLEAHAAAETASLT